MSRKTLAALAVVAVFVLVVAVLAVVLGGSNESSVAEDDAGATPSPSATTSANEGEAQVVRPDSHVLGEEGATSVTFVEFLDFECEACGAFYPVMEQLREQYAGEITFVARYFPLPGHFNSERAARAVESAARQGEFEAMYQKMFDTQDSWGEQQEPLDDLFRGYAEELGLDMAQYDADYPDPEVAARVQQDVDDGTALGVTGTPSFFLDGERFEPSSFEQLTGALDQAVADAS